MKIVLLNTHDRLGGASIAAYRLHQGLRSLGQDSRMLVKHKQGSDPAVTTLPRGGGRESRWEWAYRKIERQAIEDNRTALSNTRFSLPYPGHDVSRMPLVREADVVNLHWVAMFQSVESIAGLLTTGPPLVWTLHDQNPFSGGCHYSAGCLGYLSDCRDCPQLRDNTLQLPESILRAKKEWWRGGDLTIVTPSRWLADCARRSALFGSLRIEVIANSLEHEVYRPRDKASAKRELGLDPGRLYLLFGSLIANNKRKGFAHFVGALRYCLRQDRFRSLADAGGVALMELGPSEAELRSLGIPLHPLGLVTDDQTLALIFAAADMVIIPSEEENLPNMMLEALACGTPVVGFAVGGIPDVVADGVNGALAAPRNPVDLGEAILSLAFDGERRKRLGENGRRLIERDYKLSDQARKYLGLFEDLRAGAKRHRVPGTDRSPRAAGGAAIDLAALFPALFRRRRWLPWRPGSPAVLKRAASWERNRARLVFLLRNSGFRSTCRFMWGQLTAWRDKRR